MNSSDWIDARTACALLGVKAQTLYSYVSRGQLRARADEQDCRRSLYAQADVDALRQRNRRPRARAEVAARAIRWGDPVLDTAICELRDGQLWLRGRALLDCAEQLTLEDMAAHLWQVDTIAPAPPPTKKSPPADASSDPLGRALEVLSRRVGQGGACQDTARQGAQLLSDVTNALLGRAATGPIHLRLAQAWGVTGPGREDLRHALVLLSDHELNPSTFAVRIAASTGASLPAALLAGLATLSGPRHGNVARRAREALQATAQGQMRHFLASQAGQTPYGYGFGHPLYPGGDPRARAMLDRLPAQAAPLDAVRQLSQALGEAPNIDAALAALALVHALPPDAAFTLFAVGRLVGWVTHATEQAQSGELIRPRARHKAAPTRA